MKKIFDPIRKCWLESRPEEEIRQNWIRTMVEHLSYPKYLLGVEVYLDDLPHLSQNPFSTRRRLDLICYAKKIHPQYELFPLLIIEFKNSGLHRSILQQVIGYNQKIGAPYVAMVNQDQAQTFWLNRVTGKYDSVHFLPSYRELIRSIQPGK